MSTSRIQRDDPSLARIRHSALALAILATTACSDGPTAAKLPPNPIDVTYRFCTFDRPSWFAFKNEGYDWIPVLLRGSLEIRFPATQRLAVAQYSEPGTGSANLGLVVRYMTADELNAKRCPDDDFGPRTYAGTIANVPTGGRVYVGAGARFTVLPEWETSFIMNGLPDAPMDLVAILRQGQLDEKYIVRHGIDERGEVVLPVLDFNSAEAKAPDSLTISIQGAANATLTSAFLTFWPERTSPVALSFVEGAGATLRVGAVPAALLAPGDVHRLQVAAALSPTSVMCANESFATRDRTIVLGRPLSEPRIDFLRTSPMLLPRLRLASQSEYPDLVSFRYYGDRPATIVVTAGYLGGTPATWELAVPDLTTVGGFKKEWALHQSANDRWVVDASATTMPMHFGSSPPPEGQTYRCAYRQSSQSIP